MNFKFCSLSSGSSGNCQYIETDKIRILIDVGFSGKRIKDLLSSINVCPSSLDGILISHEHIDHIKGAGIMSRRYNIPIFANEETWQGMEGLIGKISEKNIRIFQTGENFALKDLDILPVEVFHDAREPVAFIVRKGRKKLSLVTDTGMIDSEITSHLENSDLYFIESNHDIQMLKEGSYPWYLKERILSARGHMSNVDTGKILGQIVEGRGEKILLAHLSAENNLPSLAIKTVGDILEEKGINLDRDLSLGLSHRDRPSIIYSL